MSGGKRSGNHTAILVALLVGVLAGAIAQIALGRDNAGLKAFVDNVAAPVGQIWLRLLFMIVVPLVASALVLGVAEIGDARKIGRVGLYVIVMTVVLSGTAVVIGLAGVNLIRPGDGFTQESRDNLIRLYGDPSTAEKRLAQAEEAKTLSQSLVELVPRNPLEEAVRALDGGILPLMVFALIFGIALATTEREKTELLRGALEGVFAVSLKVIDIAMKLAPIGVFALVFATATQVGFDALIALGKYVALVLGALLVHFVFTYSLALRLIARLNPIDFFWKIRDVILTAFATSSSNATLPTALRVAENDLKLPRDVSRFVLTVGATANQNGTALFEGITVIFLAQAFGVDLSLGQQLVVMGLAIVGGIGTAGVPGGAWPFIALILGRVGVPGASIAMLLGIDRPLDMSRTVLNVVGDLTIAACVSRLSGGQIDPEPAPNVA